MIRNTDICERAFDTFEPFEISQAEILRTGKARFEIDKEYFFTPERAEDWVNLGRCIYVH